MKKILFLEEMFHMQGSTRAMVDYAHFNEKLLGNKSILAFGQKENFPPWTESPFKEMADKTLDSLSERFDVFFYKDINDLENFIDKNNIHGMYNIKSGEPVGVFPKNTKTLVHSVFPQPISNVHGHKFAFVSKWLSDVCSGGRVPFVPHLINVPKIDKQESRKHIRNHFNIPENAFVYGRIGGYNDFNLPFVYSAISNALNARKDLYFLLICTKPFIKHERVIYVDPIHDLKQKYTHIAACDAMIHARHHGETFGLAIAEFCALNKPILTWKHGHGKGYIDILKNDAIYYEDENDLFHHFLNFIPDTTKDYNSYRDYNPKNVMKQFNDVFLNNI